MTTMSKAACRLPLLLALTLGVWWLPGRARASEGTTFLLLGEVHDNAEHHQQRAARIKAMLRDGRRTTVVFEQIPAHRTEAVAVLLKDRPVDAETLVDEAQLDRKYWRWPLHKPLIEASLQGRANIAGGNLSREALRPLMKGLSEASWPGELHGIVLKTPWGPAQQQALVTAIDEGHCGALPKAMHEPMALAQRARDAAMAHAMLAASRAGAERVVLIAGNGHVDRELGVPRYLEAAGTPPSAIHAVGFVEEGQAGAGRYDEQVRTVKALREDPCKSLRP